MLKNYLKIAVRNILKSKVYSSINIIGLAIGLTGFILISILINNEMSYDSFHTKIDRIYRVVEIQNQKNIGKLKIAVTMGPLSQAMKDYFPGVEKSARMMPSPSMLFKVGDTGFFEDNVSFADPSVFGIFTLKMLEGNPETSLQEPFSIVLTRSIASKYFGNEDAMNKSFSVSSPMGNVDFKVTGIIEDYPENSHVYFDMLASMSTLDKVLPWLKSWGNNSLATYVLLNKNTRQNDIENQFPQFIQKYIPPDKVTGEKSDLEMYLQPIKDVHLYSDDIVYQTYNHNKGSIDTVYLFSSIALFILLIACINFMNLATARSSKRIKEISMRKVLGATRKNLITQFLGEALIISIASLLISLLLVSILLPYFKDIFEGRIISTGTFTTGFILELLGITLFAGLLSGSYPAIFLSKFKPSNASKSSVSGAKEGSLLRKVLVVLQFSIAVSLIVCTGIVIDQMNFIRNKDLGFNKDQVLYLPLRGKDVLSKIDVLKNQLAENPNIISSAGSSGLSGASGSEGVERVLGTGGQVSLMMRKSYVDFDYMKTMEMNIVQGRGFSRNQGMDSTGSVIINEAAVKKFGWKDPIGKQFEGDPVKTVIGVVKDFNFFSLHAPIGPLIMSIDPGSFRYLLVKIKPQNISSTVDFVKTRWQELFPGVTFDYSFLDQYFDDVYKSDRRTGNIFGFFSGFAIFIACLGLFGLAAFTAEQRTKEMGVRKVLGASIGGIILLLCKDFVKLVLISCLVAVPLSYLVMDNWLSDFAYRVGITWWIFVLSGFVALTIALITVSFQAIKAANANPVESLRYE